MFGAIYGTSAAVAYKIRLLHYSNYVKERREPFK